MNYLSFITSALSHFFVITILLFIFSFQFLPKKFTNLQENSFSRFDQVNVNLAIFFLVSYYSIYLGIPGKVVFIAIFVVSGIFLMLSLRAVNWRSILNKRPQPMYLIYAAIGSVWAVAPGLWLGARNDVTFGMQSTGNNDVAMYAMIATDYLKSGFNDSLHLSSYSINIIAQSATYPGPMLLISTFASLLGLSVWQVMSMVMCFAIAYSILALHRLATQIAPTISQKIASLLAVMVMIMPLMSYLVGHYFLAQILAIGVSASLVSLILEVRSTHIFSTKYAIDLASLSVLGVFIYPHLLVPLVIASLFVLSLSLLKEYRRIGSRAYVKIFFSTGIGFSLSALVLINTWGFNIATFKLTGNGWPLPFLTPQAIFLFHPWLGKESSEGLLLLSWIVFIAIAIAIVVKSRISKSLRLEILIAFAATIVAVIYLVTQRDIPLNNYTNWKLLSYIAPIFGVVLLALFSILGKAQRNIVIIGFCVLLATPTTNWSPTLKYNSGTITADMADLAKNKALEDYGQLNIETNPWFETMALYSILENKRLHLNSSNYVITSSNAKWCTLVRLDNIEQTTFKKINSTFGLKQSEDKNCGSPGLPNYMSVKPGERYNFSISGDGSRMLSSGWSGLEAWGVWSNDKNSVLKFKFEQPLIKDQVVTFVGNIFAPKDMSQEIVFVLNGQEIHSQVLSGNIGSQSIRVVIPSELVNDRSGIVELQLKYSSPISPKELNISTDDRSLAFGLIEIKF
jgi:hypothetical protein